MIMILFLVMVLVIVVMRFRVGRDRTRFGGFNHCTAMNGVLDNHADELRFT
jgi:hypothetical protein